MHVGVCLPVGARVPGHDRIDDERLPPRLGGHPAGLVGEVRPDDGDDEDRHEPALLEQRAAPEEEQGQERQADEGRSEADHEVIGLEDQRHIRPILLRKLLQTGDRPREVLVDEEAEAARHGEAVIDAAGLRIGDAEQRQVGGAGLVVAFQGRELGRLRVSDRLGLEVAGDTDGDAGNRPKKEGDGERLLRKVEAAAAQDVVGRDAHDEEGAEDEGAEEDVEEPVHTGRVEHDGPEVGDLGPDLTVVFDEMETGRRLLPRVGDDDPDGGEDRTEGDHQRGEEVHAFGDAVPAEDEDGQEAGLQEEGENAFRRQGRSENVADVAGVVRPVGAELELHDDAGGDAHGEVDGEDAGPEAGHGVVAGVAGSQVHGLHEDQEGAEADRQRREQVVEHDGQGELHARQGQHIHRWASFGLGPAASGSLYGFGRREGNRKDGTRATSGEGARPWGAGPLSPLPPKRGREVGVRSVPSGCGGFFWGSALLWSLSFPSSAWERAPRELLLRVWPPRRTGSRSSPDRRSQALLGNEGTRGRPPETTTAPVPSLTTGRIGLATRRPNLCKRPTTVPRLVFRRVRRSRLLHSAECPM